MWHFHFTVAVLEVYLHSKFQAGSGQAPVFLSVSVVMGCSPSAKAAPGAVGMKRTQIKKLRLSILVLLVYGLWAAGRGQDLQRPSLYFPLPHQVILRCEGPILGSSVLTREE